MPRGGRRPGAGRPAKKAASSQSRQVKTPEPAVSQTSDAKEFLIQVIRGAIRPTALQMEAAKALLPFQHRKLGESGKKDQQKEDASKVARRFAPAPPRLSLVPRQPTEGTKA